MNRSKFSRQFFTLIIASIVAIPSIASGASGSSCMSILAKLGSSYGGSRSTSRPRKPVEQPPIVIVKEKARAIGGRQLKVGDYGYTITGYDQDGNFQTHLQFKDGKYVRKSILGPKGKFRVYTNERGKQMVEYTVDRKSADEALARVNEYLGIGTPAKADSGQASRAASDRGDGARIRAGVVGFTRTEFDRIADGLVGDAADKNNALAVERSRSMALARNNPGALEALSKLKPENLANLEQLGVTGHLLLEIYRKVCNEDSSRFNEVAAMPAEQLAGLIAANRWAKAEFTEARHPLVRLFPVDERSEGAKLGKPPEPMKAWFNDFKSHGPHQGPPELEMQTYIVKEGRRSFVESVRATQEYEAVGKKTKEFEAPQLSQQEMIGLKRGEGVLEVSGFAHNVSFGSRDSYARAFVGTVVRVEAGEYGNPFTLIVRDQKDGSEFPVRAANLTDLFIKKQSVANRVAPVEVMKHSDPRFPHANQYKLALDSKNAAQNLGEIEAPLPLPGRNDQSGPLGRGNNPLGAIQIALVKTVGRQLSFSVRVPTGSGQLAGIEIDGKFHQVGYMRDGFMDIEGGQGEYLRLRNPSPDTQETLFVVLTLPQ